jgi:hypothetical protein
MHGLKHPEEVAAMLKAILLVLVFKAFRKALCSVAALTYVFIGRLGSLIYKKHTRQVGKG